MLRFISESGHQHADYILSGIPFSTLPEGVGELICAETQRALRPGGEFLVYQYSAFVRHLLAGQFNDIAERVEWRNIPPCRTFRAMKAERLAQAA